MILEVVLAYFWVFVLGGGRWWLVVVDIFWVVVGTASYILSGGGFVLGGVGWWWIYLGWCWVVLGTFWVVVGGDGLILVGGV